MPLFYNIKTLMYRPCPNCLSFLLQTFSSPADSSFRNRQLFFDGQLKACFDEVDRARLQLALQQFAKENNSSPGDISGADPGAGKGRGTNRLSCRWLERARFSC